MTEVTVKEAMTVWTAIETLSLTLSLIDTEDIIFPKRLLIFLLYTGAAKVIATNHPTQF